MRIFLVPLALVMFFFTAFAPHANANWEKIPVSDFKVAPPPLPGSPGDEADFDLILQWQETRTEAQCEAAANQRYAEFQVMYKASGLLTKRELKKYAPFFEKINSYGEKISSHFKDSYRRPRPYNEDPRVNPCVQKPGSNKAYPSTHATLGALSACVLAVVMPDRAAQLVPYGDSLGDLRYIVGVHHPTDVAAGQDLGRQICKRLLQETDFRKDLDNL